jgi:hypothetical protein
MSRAAVDDILQQIDQLSDEDRLHLQFRLAEISEEDWRQEADRARRIAREKGIDQAVIDEACEHVRYRP